MPTIEDVARLEEYMSQLPIEMEENQSGLAQMMSDQLVLDEFEYVARPSSGIPFFLVVEGWLCS